MEDLTRVADAFTKANDADIVDHQKLINLVGDEVLIGADILRLLRQATHERGHFEERIDHYRRIQNNVTALDRLNPIDWTYSTARRRVRRYEGFRDLANEIIAELERKIDKYNEIEQATKELFIISRELREQAKLGLGHIRVAAAGLPNSFYSTALTSWRADISVKKDNAVQHIINRVIEKDDDGNIIGYNWEKLMTLDNETLTSVLVELS